MSNLGLPEIEGVRIGDTYVFIEAENANTAEEKVDEACKNPIKSNNGKL